MRNCVPQLEEHVWIYDSQIRQEAVGGSDLLENSTNERWAAREESSNP